FSDLTSGITLILLLLASNFIQYISVDGGQSHAWIFPLYVYLLYATIKWHERPGILWAAFIGLIIGLATISRPTEAIMIFIPMFWNTQSKELSKQKWQLVRNYKHHLIYVAVFGLIGIMPQLIYWKIVTGSFVYDVGSKWDFLTPHLRVLTGWEKGWLIYTPVTLFFIAGLFFIRKFSFRYSVLIFCLANIYIIISWHDWKYGGSYSTRALTQSYPVFALPLAAFVEYISRKKWKYLFYVAGGYLLFVNLFQIRQYNNTVLHFYDMNRQYYSRIYLNPAPTPLDMSLLDTKDWIRNEKNFKKEEIFHSGNILNIEAKPGADYLLVQKELIQSDYLKIEASIRVSEGFYGSYLVAELCSNDSVKLNKIRLFNPISQRGQINQYEFYVKVPDDFIESEFKLFIQNQDYFNGSVHKLRITGFSSTNKSILYPWLSLTSL
ncbi:MAG: hypothetical protein K8R53_13335, partial [Bacteroidales bacterium]|nr:hypothetical protein [Bacteroidales bacterium]